MRLFIILLLLMLIPKISGAPITIKEPPYEELFPNNADVLAEFKLLESEPKKHFSRIYTLFEDRKISRIIATKGLEYEVQLLIDGKFVESGFNEQDFTEMLKIIELDYLGYDLLARFYSTLVNDYPELLNTHYVKPRFENIALNQHIVKRIVDMNPNAAGVAVFNLINQICETDGLQIFTKKLDCTAPSQWDSNWQLVTSSGKIEQPLPIRTPTQTTATGTKKPAVSSKASSNSYSVSPNTGTTSSNKTESSTSKTFRATQSGKTVFGSDGTTYRSNSTGNRWHGSDGSSYRSNSTGTTVYGSDGTTYRQRGNTTYGSDGSSCRTTTSGRYTYCN